jgi:hypothetical protein
MSLVSPTPHLDRFGYYLVDGQKHLHKLTAHRAADNDINRVKFVFNDQAYDSYDWTREPEPSVPLWEFYRRRAQALRDRYEYLVLMYSGGPDSKNMLDVFLQNNIRIDEIINFNSFERTQKYHGTIHNADYVYNAKATLDQLRKSNPEIVITVVDEIEITKSYQRRLRLQGDFEFVVGSHGCINGWLFRSAWVRDVPHIWNKIQAGTRVGIIKGQDKPQIHIDSNGKYFTQFIDLIGVDKAMELSYDSELKSSELFEFFYQSDDTAPLIIKQLHVLKNFMDRMQSPDLYEDEETHLSRRSKSRVHFFCTSKFTKRNLKYAEFHRLIYPGSTEGFRTPKTQLAFSSRPEDTWWLENLEPEYTAFWYKSLYKAVAYADIMHHRDNGADIRGLPVIKSKPFYLE